MPDFVTGEKLTAANLDAHVDWNKGLVDNLGLTVTIDSPAAGDITIAFKQGDGSTDATAANPIKVSFSGRQAALKVATAKSLKLDSTDHLGLDSYASNKATVLFLYAIDRGGTLEFGVGRLPDYTRATSNFVNTEGTATTRDKVFCTAAITTNDICRVVGYFKATYNTTTPDWDSITAESLIIGPPPGPHPRLTAKAMASWDDNAGTIDDAENIVSISTLGLLTFDLGFANVNYCAFINGKRGEVVGLRTDAEKLTGSFRADFFDVNGNPIDPTQLHAIFFGDQ